VATWFGAAELAAVRAVALISTGVLTAAGLRLLSYDVDPIASCLAMGLFFASPCFTHAAFQASPDLACLAVILIALLAAKDHPVAAGALAGAATLLRFNAVFLPVFLLITARRPKVLLGLALPILPWMVVSLRVKKRIFWLPSSHASVGFHPDFLPRHAFPEQLLGEAPFEFLWRALYRGLISGPIEIGAQAAWWPASLLALGAVVLIWRAPAVRVKHWMLLLLLSWIPVAPIHFEARYYPLQVLAFSLLAARVVVGISKYLAPVVAAIAIVTTFGATASYREEHARHEATRRATLELADQMRAIDGCITTDLDAYTFSTFRLAMRQAGLEHRICCCGEKHSAARGVVTWEKGRPKLYRTAAPQ
jgi:hypothetical protein